MSYDGEGSMHIVKCSRNGDSENSGSSGIPGLY